MARTKSRGNGQGTARQRGSTWQACVVIGWKVIGDPPHTVPIYKTKSGFKTKREALAYCPTLLAGQRRPESAPSVQHYWDTYQSTKLPKLSDSKQTAYWIAWNKMESIATRSIDALTVADLQRLVSRKAPTYYPARDMRVLLGHLFDIAGAEGWVNRDLPDYITLPPMNEKERIPFTPEEQAALWKSYESGNADAAIPLVMIYTGMMTGEMRRLTVDMIDFESRTITGVGLKTKVRKDAAVYLTTSIIPVLQDMARGKSGLVLPISEDEFYARYYAALSEAGCRRLTPYSCRHTTATALAVTENIAPQTVRKIMRWSTVRMLDRYAHPDDNDALTAIDALSPVRTKADGAPQSDTSEGKTPTKKAPRFASKTHKIENAV